MKLVQYRSPRPVSKLEEDAGLRSVKPDEQTNSFAEG